MTEVYLGFTKPEQTCPQQDEEHAEHTFISPEGDERSCNGRYRVLDDYDQWILTSAVGDPSKGWLESTYTYYPIDSARVHEKDWDGHVTSKTWVNGTQFRAALAAARARWPRG